MAGREIPGWLLAQYALARGDRARDRITLLLARIHVGVFVLVALRGELVPLRLDLAAGLRELLDLETVHQHGHLEPVAVEQFHQPPDPDPVAVFALGHSRHVLGKDGVRWRSAVA